MVAGLLRNRPFAAFLILGALLLPACNREQKRIIGVVPKATSHLFWIKVEEGVRAAGKDLKVEVLWNGAPSETDYARQVQIVDSMINQRVSGIAVAATERKILNSSLHRAMAAGIPVVVFDSGVDSDEYVSFIATNNYEGGALGARALAKAIGGKGKVGLMMGSPGSSSTMEREKGFEETIAKEFPAITIAARQFSMSDRAKALAAAENMLTGNADLAGFFASADPGSVGAIKAIQARGLAGKVHLVTFDGGDQQDEACKNHVADAMVVQDPFQIGYQSVQSVVKKLDGQTLPKRVDLAPRVQECR